MERHHSASAEVEYFLRTALPLGRTTFLANEAGLCHVGGNTTALDNIHRDDYDFGLGSPPMPMQSANIAAWPFDSRETP
jgi:hypothetical protein